MSDAQARDVLSANSMSCDVPGARSGSSESFRSWRILACLCVVFVGLGRASAGPLDGSASPLVPSASSSSYRVQLWTTANGLPQNTINEILQTPNGELWIATFGGLLRFDGLVFRAFDIDSVAGLTTNRITSMVADGDAGLWLMTQDGELLRFSESRIREAHRMEPTSIETVALVEDRAHVLWARNSSGVVRRFVDGAWTKVNAPIIDAGYEDMCAEIDGTLAAASGPNLLIFDAAGALQKKIKAPARVLALAADAHGGVYIGLEDGLARERDGQIERVNLDPAPKSSVLAIHSDGGAGLWLGLHDGLAHAEPRADGQGWSMVPITGLPSNFEVRSLELDREGSLWVGSRGQGIARVTRNHLWLYARPFASGSSALVSDGAGGALCGFECNGLGRLDAEGQTTMWPLKRNAAGYQPCIHVLHYDVRGQLWFASQGRLFRQKGAEFEQVFALLNEKEHIHAITDTDEGDLWLGTSAGVVQRLSADARALDSRTLPETIQCFVRGSDGALWIGGDESVFRMRGDEITRFGRDLGMPGGGVRDIVPEADGSAWIATYGGGLARLSNGRVTRITRAQGLPDSSLTRIQDDGLGRLWISSNRGLIIASREEWLAVAEGRQRSVDPVVLGPESGMPEANYGSPAGFRGEDGRLWFGVIDGAVRVDPREFPFNRIAPRLRIEHATADDREIALERTVEVPAATRRLVVNFAAFSLVAPERVRFRCRLVGFDDEWLDTGAERSTSFTALAPGDYTFEVLARNEDGVWGAEPTSLQIHVAASWWQTGFARIAFSMLFLAAVVAVFEFRTRVIARRARVLIDAAEERRRAEESASRLREELAHIARVATAGELATSLAHEVNQPLAAIVANAQAGRRFLARDGFDRRDLDEIFGDIAQQGQRASDVIRRLREFLRKHPSERARLDLNSVLHEALPLVRRELEDHRVRVTFDSAEPLPPVSADPVQMQQVFVNLVKNACEAMGTQERERRIELRTRADGAHVSFQVVDNGPGISADVAARLFQPFVTTKSDGMGLGLAICQSIVEAHGGSLRAESVTGGGVAFVVTLPTVIEDEEVKG